MERKKRSKNMHARTYMQGEKTSRLFLLQLLNHFSSLENDSKTVACFPTKSGRKEY